ncbi:glycine cleavage T C-terminal barrel domain-containing protein [Anaerolineales bacterium HSG6]|nr:glycine cleavage T C-terminal barrel domain-containing protein [Anaerolineales bacterium HSG6]
MEVHCEPLNGNEHQVPVFYNGEPSGIMSTVTYSPRLEKNIALAIVPIANTKLGTNLTIEASWGLIESTVVPLPL